MMFTKSLKHLQVTSTVCEVLTGLVYKVLPALASAPSSLHPEHKGLKTPVADAPLKQTGYPRLSISEGKVKRGRWEGNNYCHRLCLLRQICTYRELEKPPAEKEEKRDTEQSGPCQVLLSLQGCNLSPGNSVASGKENTRSPRTSNPNTLKSSKHTSSSRV